MAINKLGFRTDAFGQNSFIRNPPLKCVNVVLLAGKSVVFIPPATATCVIFSANGEFWVNANGDATVPTESREDGPELNPLGYEIGGDKARLSIVAPRDTRMSIAVYS